MKYYFLNIKYNRKSRSQEWLDEKRRAPIFFGNSRIEEIISGDSALTEKHNLSTRQITDCKLFCEVGLDSTFWEKSKIVTIDQGYVWIYRPVDKITETPDEPGYDGYVKSFPIQFLCSSKKVKEVPLILASMKTNKHFSMGTFKEIDERYVGNILAIESMLSNDLSHYVRNIDFHPLDCLSSIELETLIAKIFESRGCFVPAYKGGFLSGIDLIVWNHKGEDLNIDGIHIPKGERVSIQVKMIFTRTDLSKSVAQYNIGCNDNVPKNCYGREWVWKQVEASEMVTEWVNCSLSWLPHS